MAITLTSKKTSVSMKLNNGTDSEGKIKQIGLNLGNLKATDFTSEDAQRAQNIINALTQCLSKALLSVEKTHVDVMQESA